MREVSSVAGQKSSMDSDGLPGVCMGEPADLSRHAATRHNVTVKSEV